MKKNIIILIAMAASIGIVLYTYKSAPSSKETLSSSDAVAQEAPANTGTEIADTDTLKAAAMKITFTPSVPDGAVDVLPLTYGNTSAPIIIEEFASFTCSHCADFHRNMMPKLKATLIDSGLAQLRVYSFVRNAQDLEASMLVQCQKTDGERKNFAHALFDGQEQWAFTAQYQTALKTIARLGGMDDAAYDQCVKNDALLQKIVGSRQWFDAQVKVDATPYFRIGSEVVKGTHDVDAFVTAIRKQVQPHAATPAASPAASRNTTQSPQN